MRSFVIFLLFSLTVLLAGEGKLVTYSVDGKMYEGYYASPSKDAPLVFLVHDWDGLGDYEIKRAHMLYEMGYATFAVDLFGKGVRPEKTEDKKMLTGSLYKDRALMRKLLESGLESAKAQGANTDKAVGIGYCFGGAAILEMGRSGAPLKAFIPFHGGLKTPEGQDYTKIKGEVVVFHGTADASVSMQDFADLAVQLETAKVPHEMHTFSGAPHAFTVFGSSRYHEEADKKSWARFSEYLKKTF